MSTAVQAYRAVAGVPEPAAAPAQFGLRAREKLVDALVNATIARIRGVLERELAKARKAGDVLVSEMVDTALQSALWKRTSSGPTAFQLLLKGATSFTPPDTVSFRADKLPRAMKVLMAQLTAYYVPHSTNSKKKTKVTGSDELTYDDLVVNENGRLQFPPRTREAIRILRLIAREVFNEPDVMNGIEHVRTRKRDRVALTTIGRVYTRASADLVGEYLSVEKAFKRSMGHLIHALLDPVIAHHTATQGESAEDTRFYQTLLATLIQEVKAVHFRPGRGMNTFTKAKVVPHFTRLLTTTQGLFGRAEEKELIQTVKKFGQNLTDLDNKYKALAANVEAFRAFRAKAKATRKNWSILPSIEELGLVLPDTSINANKKVRRDVAGRFKKNAYKKAENSTKEKARQKARQKAIKAAIEEAELQRKKARYDAAKSIMEKLKTPRALRHLFP